MGLFDFLKGSSGQGNSGAGPDAALASDLWAFGRFEILTPQGASGAGRACVGDRTPLLRRSHRQPGGILPSRARDRPTPRRVARVRRRKAPSIAADKSSGTHFRRCRRGVLPVLALSQYQLHVPQSGRDRLVGSSPPRRELPAAHQALAPTDAVTPSRLANSAKSPRWGRKAITTSSSCIGPPTSTSP